MPKFIASLALAVLAVTGCQAAHAAPAHRHGQVCAVKRVHGKVVVVRRCPVKHRPGSGIG